MCSLPGIPADSRLQELLMQISVEGMSNTLTATEEQSAAGTKRKEEAASGAKAKVRIDVESL